MTTRPCVIGNPSAQGWAALARALPMTTACVPAGALVTKSGAMGSVYQPRLPRQPKFGGHEDSKHPGEASV